MKTDEMVNLLGSAFRQDVMPYKNQGYPILNGVTKVLFKNNVTEKNITVYPNPTTGNVSITLPENVHNAFFTLYDMQGKRLIRKEVNNQDRVEVNNLAAGIYIYHIKTNKENHTGKLRINNQ
jgi:hypothetical protein